ncbi:MAG: hypothetical protein K0R00_828 [Herbinix sp.]|jgi:hypothetical protein|nr:hypothetical protein [Herbinix sp.]
MTNAYYGLSFIPLLSTVVGLGMLIATIYIMYLAIKALRIYINKNS